MSLEPHEREPFRPRSAAVSQRTVDAPPPEAPLAGPAGVRLDRLENRSVFIPRRRA